MQRIYILLLFYINLSFAAETITEVCNLLAHSGYDTNKLISIEDDHYDEFDNGGHVIHEFHLFNIDCKNPSQPKAFIVATSHTYFFNDNGNDSKKRIEINIKGIPGSNENSGNKFLATYDTHFYDYHFHNESNYHGDIPGEFFEFSKLNWTAGEGCVAKDCIKLVFSVSGFSYSSHPNGRYFKIMNSEVILYPRTKIFNIQMMSPSENWVNFITEEKPK